MVNFDDCYEQLKGKIGEMEITPRSIIKVLQFAMEVVESSDAKGKEQKELVEKLVKHAVIEAPISDFKEKLMVDMIDEGILGDMTSMIVSASKGELNINAVAATAGVCCKSCFGALKK
tara:strand:+ start:206 stop:559 length:354 start_codon:yes stop_codon:yes gene_type:complete